MSLLVYLLWLCVHSNVILQQPCELMLMTIISGSMMGGMVFCRFAASARV
jgi:hypothetical protein